MMNPVIQERFDQLLGFIKDPAFKLTIENNSAAARELVSTLLNTGLLLPDEFMAYQGQITAARLVAGAIELKRETDKELAK